jgi:hypothetical protein
MKQTPRHLIQGKIAESVVAGLDASCVVTYGEPSDNSAVRYDFDFPHAIARFTWWSDASYASESLAVDGRQIVCVQGTALDASAAIVVIENLVAATRLAAAT